MNTEMPSLNYQRQQFKSNWKREVMPGESSVHSDIFKQEIKKNDIFGRASKPIEDKKDEPKKKGKNKMQSPL
jgi:hypothetical protein